MGEIINVQNLDGQLLVSSREIATNFEKRHSDVMKSIEEKIKVNEVLRSPQYFIESSYTDKSNRQSKEYLMTRDGFSFLVMGFNGAKADNWKLKYIEAFNKMEQQIINPYASMSKELQAILMVDQKQQEHDKRIRILEDKMTINYELALNIQNAVKIKAIEILGGKESEAYKKISSKVFSKIHKDLKSAFKVNSYKNIAVKNYDKALKFIDNWEIKDEVLKYAIEGLNGQLKFA